MRGEGRQPYRSQVLREIDRETTGDPAACALILPPHTPREIQLTLGIEGIECVRDVRL
jgi:hypothetical protein